MLEKPSLPDDQITACLRAAYGQPVEQIVFLPLGADPNSAVYRATATDATTYFVKLRSGPLDDLPIRLPGWLAGQGLQHIIAPLRGAEDQLWARLGDWTLTLYPFVDGHDGYELPFTERHWHQLGAALKHLHTLELPPALARAIPKETFDAGARQRVRQYLDRSASDTFADPVAAQAVALLRAQRAAIERLVARTEQLALEVQARGHPFVVCHADIHAANVLIDADDRMYIVDWDTAILAPKERDLMFAGGGQYANARTPAEEETLFYQGYGPAEVDQAALAYYRYERIIQDFAIFCDQLLTTTEGGTDREQSLQWFAGNFQPGGVLDIARAADSFFE